MLYELVYSSIPAALNPSEDFIESLLERARAKNEALGITGLLIYRNNEFVQLLEGEQAAVQELFREIEHDDRHHHPFVYWQGAIERRSFADWNMAYSPLDEGIEEIPSFKAGARRGLDAFFRPANASTGRKFLVLVHEAMKASPADQDL